MKMIVCIAENYAIGSGNNLLFSLPPDMKFFRETTLGKVVIMGRSTLDSFPGGKALKNRINIVLTRDKNFSRENTISLNSVDEVLEYVKQFDSDDVYIIGGAQIYELFEPYCEVALVTKERKSPDADKYFFNIDKSPHWQKNYESELMEHEGTQFTFCRYIRN